MAEKCKIRKPIAPTAQQKSPVGYLNTKAPQLHRTYKNGNKVQVREHTKFKSSLVHLNHTDMHHQTLHNVPFATHIYYECPLNFHHSDLKLLLHQTATAFLKAPVPLARINSASLGTTSAAIWKKLRSLFSEFQN